MRWIRQFALGEGRSSAVRWLRSVNNQSVRGQAGQLHMALKGATQVVWISDLHVGSTVGLSPKRWRIDESNIHEASESQLLLLDFWQSFWKRRKKDSRPLVTIIGGDAVDGDHHNTLQLWTQDELVQVDASVELLKPAVNLSEKAYFLRGTSAHVGQSGRYDCRVARELGVPSYYHLQLEICNVLFDLEHHGPGTGKRVWNLGNTARSYARHIAMAHILRGVRAPDCIIRGHVHKAIYETVRDAGHTTEMIISPSWQFKTEYAHKVASEDDVADIGGVVIGVEYGKITDVTLDVIHFEQAQVIKV